MKRHLMSALIIGVLLVAGQAATAQEAYTWTDTHGIVHYSGIPPKDGQSYKRIDLLADPPATPTPQQQPLSPSADNNSDHAPVTPATDKATVCQRISDNIHILQEQRPVLSTGSNGKQSILTKEERQKQLAVAEMQQSQYCGQHQD